jgi:shikimate kinase
MQKIIITGFMGSGKSTVARTLAQLRHCGMVDLDDVIAAAEGRSAGTIIEVDGEPRFRELERQALLEVLKTEGDLVVALGGGAWMSETNRHVIKAHNATSVWLDAPFELCWKRIEPLVGQRPLAQNKPAALKLFSERTSCYELADFRVSVTEQKSAEEIAAEINEALTAHPN